MAEPLFRLCLTYADGTKLPIRAGGVEERDFLALCKQAVLAQGVGFLKTEAQVARALEIGLTQALMTVKKDARRFL